MPRHNKERFVLDPDGDVTLVFNSKDAIVSKPHDLNILTKEKSNAMKVAHWLEARKALELSTETCMIEDKADRDNVYMIPAATDHVAPTVVHYAESMSSGRYTTVNGLPAPRLRLYNCGEADIEVRISSKHFALKSRIFRKILASNLQERPAAQNMEDIRVHLPGDHIDGMLVILKVLHYDFDHAANGQVNPRGLMQLALMVDKYKLAPTLKFWTRKWHDEMRISDRSFKWWPSRRSPDVMSWVWLLHALQLDKELAVMENIAWNVMTETLFECKLPMDNILGNISAFMLENANSTFRGYEEEKNGCNFFSNFAA